MDVGAVDEHSVGPALKSFLLAGLVTPAAVAATIDRHSERGRHGIVAAREALAAWDFGRKPPDSELEVVMHGLLRRFGLPPATFHVRLLGFEIDFRIDDSPVLLECDGWETHGKDREQYERDRVRDALLHEAGYVVIRFTWRTIVRRPAWVAQRIEGNLRTWAPHLRRVPTHP